ncbi:serine hydrolase [Virgibacillus alimentarius]|uniref:D-alanyl-D-alanine carboxypeptidase n=1 Tax=Virgibacillus alimentarius TaxID=698769 RepID=A0ABS4S8C9_9BACI|nr:serine hydrolase [Virgibacillus alimentarius]MBP2257740.1 D-alanyl-D-alanine carboxypeptidase [Virgibacillus alimentarius]
MNMYAWVGVIGIIVLSLISLIQKEDRTKENIRKSMFMISIALGIIVAVLVFHIDYLLAIIVGFLLIILFDKKTYTKKRLIIYGSIILILNITFFILLRENPDYVLDYLKEHPESTSLYLVENGDVLSAYQADEIRPLASTVKIIIAIEYAMQIEDQKLAKDQPVPLKDLERFYIENTDGNAHENWLETMKEEDKIKNGEVALHDVARGMIANSSNANTEYLINLLGVDAINKRIDKLGIKQHDKIYPIVSALLIPEHVKTETMEEEALIQKLEKMPMEEYRLMAEQLSKDMQAGKIKAGDVTFDSSLDVQKIWSDRLPGSTAEAYGKLLHNISSDQLPEGVNATVRDLLEWPMEMHEENQETFAHLGAKGGSTAFITTNTMYAETKEGDQIEIALLIDDLSTFEGMRVRNSQNAFELKLLTDADYRKKVQKELADS